MIEFKEMEILPSIHGDKKRLHVGRNVNLVNTLFNTRSGEIFIGDDTIFGYNCMIITGRHPRIEGKLKKHPVPIKGYDIIIGKNCWISSGVIVTGNVTIGDNCVIGAGAVVTKNIPSGKFAVGIPAKIKSEV